MMPSSFLPHDAALAYQKVSDRRILPKSNTSPIVLSSGASLPSEDVLSPFGGVFYLADQAAGAIRRYRMRVCYSYPFPPEAGALEVLFVLESKQNVSFPMPLVATPSSTVATCVLSDWKTFGSGSKADIDLTHGTFTLRRAAAPPTGSRDLTIYESYIEGYDFFTSQAELLKNPQTKVAERTLFPLNFPVAQFLSFVKSSLFGTATATAPKSVGYRFLNLFGSQVNPTPAPDSDRKFRLRTCHFDEYVRIYFFICQ
jgi:hypothetical protein